MAPHESPRGDVQDVACPIVEVIDRVAGKWAVPILLAACREPVRYTQLEREIVGISRRMLTLNLRNLERDGMLLRTVYPTVPPKVEYEATARAQELREHLEGLTDWAARHRGAIAIARREYDAKQDLAA